MKKDRFGLAMIVLAGLVGCGVAVGAWYDGVGRQLARANSLAFEERWAEAAAVYRAIIASTEPGSDAWVQAHARLAEVSWMGLSDEREAAELYRRLIAVAPRAEESWIARERLADLAERRFDDVHEAIAQWQALAASGRKGADRFAWQAAKAYFRIGDYEQARRECLAIAERFPESEWADDALLLVGTSWQFEKDHEKAIAAFEDVERRFPDSEAAARARYQIGQSRAALRDWEGAQAALLSALESHPDPWRVQADLARVQQRLAEERKVRSLTPEELFAR